MQMLLAVAALGAAVLVLVPAFFITWWLAGSDGEARNPVAPILGLGLLAASIGSVVVAARLDPEPELRALLLMATPAALLVLAAPFAGNTSTGPASLREGLEGVGLLSIAPLLAAAARLLG